MSAKPTDQAPAVRPARIEDVDAFVQHVVEHVAESGREGSPHFAMSRKISRDEVRDAASSRWVRRLDEPLWGRAWLLWSEPPGARRRVVGHIELRGGRIPAEMHRAVLGMGILREFTRQGHGGRLLDAAIVWARDVASLSWIDLGVFSHNDPARKLYERAGFVAMGTRRDAFRIDDRVSVDDIMMSLSLSLR